MLRYYTETHIDTGKVEGVIIQDNEGIRVFSLDGPEGGFSGFFPTDQKYWIKLEGWDEPRQVTVTDPDLLEFNRLWNRSSRMATRASEIKESKRTAESIAKALLAK